MKPEDLSTFEKWYSENFQKEFKFNQEILTYCEMDVKILLASVLTFLRETLVQQTEFPGVVRTLKPHGTQIHKLNQDGTKETCLPNLIHPFSKGICTLSSYANQVFRGYFLPEKSLPIVTQDVEETYSSRSSKEELEYLHYVKHVEGLTDLQYGNEFRAQRRFTVQCPTTLKSHTFYADGYSASTKVKK